LLIADPDELHDHVIGVACGALTKADVAVWLARHLPALR